MSRHDSGATEPNTRRASVRRWYQFSLSSLLLVMLLVGVVAAWLHALRKERVVHDVRRQLADVSAELESSQIESQERQSEMKSEIESLNVRLEAMRVEDSRNREWARMLSEELAELRRDPARLLSHEERQLLQQFRIQQSHQKLAAEAARWRDRLQAKDWEARNAFLSRLEARHTINYSGGLDEVVRHLSEVAHVPIVIQREDLSEIQVPQIRYTKVQCEGATVEQALSQALAGANVHFVRSLRDPRMLLVYVLTEPDSPGDPRLIVTNRKRAAQRGWLPDQFVIDSTTAK